MFFELTEEQQLVQDTARRFALEEIAPTLEEEERNREFKLERVAEMGDLGFFFMRTAGRALWERDGLPRIRAYGGADCPHIRFLAPAVQHAEPRPSALGSEIRHQGNNRRNIFPAGLTGRK